MNEVMAYRNVIALPLALVICVMASPVMFAGEYVWNDDSSWDKPEAGDVVKIPDGMTVTASDGDIAKINALAAIAFGGAS